MDERTYEANLAAEKLGYAECEHVHDLPPISHYWSHRHIHPQLSALGFSGPDELFERELRGICAGTRRPLRFVSLGSGNCDLEVTLASKLRGSGFGDFIIDCFDLNPAMLARGRAAADAAGVSDYLGFIEGDLNRWQAGSEYDAVLANQSLHHIVDLERVLGEVKRALKPGGRLIVSDMIGRNGHRRWPEALEIVYEFWRQLPPSYRFNRQSGYYEEWYEDRDYSAEGFEGVRAQDILPLLLDRFHFRLFFGFANAIDPFVDRGIGPNFDATADWDRGFIDALHHRDQAAIAAGRLTPTHMLAVLCAEAVTECQGNLRPEACVRGADRAPLAVAIPASAYDDAAWPHGPAQELAAVRARLSELTAIVRRHSPTLNDLRQEVNWGEEPRRELKKRTAWALQMERQFEDRSAWAKRLEADVVERTAWAHRLDQRIAESQNDLMESVARGEELARQLEERAAWAKRLETEARRQRERADTLQAEVSGYLRNPFRLLGRMAAGVWKRLRGR